MIAPARVIAIGDIHGSASALDALLKAVAPAADDGDMLQGVALP